MKNDMRQPTVSSKEQYIQRIKNAWANYGCGPYTTH